VTLARIRRIWSQRLRSLLWKDRADTELGQELLFHFDQLVAENLAGGMTSEQARDAARRALGNIGLIEEQCRDQRRVNWLHDLKQDLAYGLRTMRGSPGFTAVVCLSLALGIGAHTAILGVAHTLLSGDLPYRDPGRIVMLRTYRLDTPQQLGNASEPDFFAFQEQTDVFETIGCSLADQKNIGAGEDGTPPERIFGQAFSPGVFESLGVEPLLGRLFREEDYSGSAPSRVVILSYRLWQRRFGGDRTLVGRDIPLNGRPTEVIGVMRPDFRFAEERVDYWVPWAIRRTSLQAGVRYEIVVGRLKNGATMENAQAELNNVAAHLARDFPDTHDGWGVRVQGIREAMFGWTKEPILTLEAATILVLAIACANIAGLLLARGSSRKREIAMRATLGAGRGRIIRQALTESLLLSLTGGLLGIGVAWVSLRVVSTITPPPNAPRLAHVSLDLPMLLLAAFTSVLAGLIFGMGPALAIFRQDLAGTLNQASRVDTPSGHRFRGILVSAQIAFAFVLLSGSALLIKSFSRLAGRDLNFQPHGLSTFEFRLPFQQFWHVVGSYQDFPLLSIDPPPSLKLERILRRLHSLPGVESVAGISNPPVNSLIVPTLDVAFDDQPVSTQTAYFLITPGFFATMKTPVIRGREFDARDTIGAPWVAIVNETAARRFWPGEDPLGKRIALDSGPSDRRREVIGVVPDIPTRTRDLSPGPIVYVSYLQQPAQYRLPWGNLLGQMTFVLRSSQNPTRLIREAQKAVAEIDPDIPLSNIAPMEDYTEARLGDLFYYSLTLGVFALVATLLAAMGTYGILAYSVARRRHEIAIRTALGARPLEIAACIGLRTILLIGVGLVAGMAAAAALTRYLASQLWNVASTDPPAFAAAALLLVLVAGLATVGPIRRSLRVDPAGALRLE
jgi:putative ABC transport system permease protein